MKKTGETPVFFNLNIRKKTEKKEQIGALYDTHGCVVDNREEKGRKKLKIMKKVLKKC